MLNAQTYTQTGNTTPLISAGSRWEVSRRESVQNDLEVPVLSPKLAVHLSSPVCLMLWTAQWLSRSTIQRGMSKCTILRQVRAHNTLLALRSPIWHTKVSLKRRKRYMTCGLNYLYLISGFASKNDRRFIIRLGSLSKDQKTKNAIKIQHSRGT